MSDADREELETLLAERDALRAEVERLKQSMVDHFQREHLAGDGPEIDRWKAEVAKLKADEQWLAMGRDYREHRLLAACQSLHKRWKKERDMRWGRELAYVVGAPHEYICDEKGCRPPDEDVCPIYYDGCNCTVEALAFNIDQARILRKALGDLLKAVEENEGLSRPCEDPLCPFCKALAEGKKAVESWRTDNKEDRPPGTDPITVEMHIATGVPYSARCHHLTRTTCVGCPDDATCRAEGRGALLEHRLLAACQSLHKRWKESQLKSCKPLFCGERCAVCCERVHGADMMLNGKGDVFHTACWAKRRAP